MKTFLRCVLFVVVLGLVPQSFAGWTYVHLNIHNVGADDWAAGGINVTAIINRDGSAYSSGSTTGTGLFTVPTIAAGATYTLDYQSGAGFNTANYYVGHDYENGGCYYASFGGAYPSLTNGANLIANCTIARESSSYNDCLISGDVNVWHTMAVASCTTNRYVTLNDSYTNGIQVTVTSDVDGTTGSPVVSYYGYSLVNYQYLLGTFACTSAISATVVYSNIPACMSPVVFNVVNSSGNWRIYAAHHVVTPQSDNGTMMVAPGGTFYYSNNVPCSDAVNWHLYASPSDGGDNVTDTGVTNMFSFPPNTPTSDPGTSSGGNSPGNTPSPASTAPPVTNLPSSYLLTNSFPLPSVLPLTNNGLIWTIGTNNDFGGTVPTMKDVGQLLYNQIGTAAGQQHSDLGTIASQAHADANAAQTQGTANANGVIGAINGGVSQNHSDMNAANANAAASAGLAHQDASAIAGAVGSLASNGPPSVSVSNNIVVNFTNYNLQSTQLGIASNLVSVVGTLGGISNLLANYSNSVNGSGSNYGNYVIDGAATNADAARSLAQTFEDMSGINNFVASFSPQLPPDDPGAGALSMMFCGQLLDFDPNTQFPAAVSMCFQGFKIASLLAFFAGVGRLYWKFIQVKASAQTGQTPDMQVEILGFGGNVLGFIVGRAVSIAFILLFSAASVWLFSNLGASIEDAFNATAFTSQIPTTAYYLLASFFPVRLIFSLACTFIIMQFTLGKIVNLAVAAARLLIN